MPTGWAGISGPGSRLSCRQRLEEEEAVGQTASGGWGWEGAGAVRAELSAESHEVKGWLVGHCNGGREMAS